MTAIRAFAPAKVNLTLHVTGQRADGYHLLQSLVMFADFGDQLDLTPGPELAMTVSGPFAEGVPTDARNLAWRAAASAGWTGQITLEKHLPHGAGIGGGSSDAAAVLRALEAPGNGLTLGADVPVCRLGRAAVMAGIGEDVLPVADIPAFSAVLVNPGAHVPTPRVFAALSAKDNPPMLPLPASGAAPSHWLDWLRAQRNDLQAPAVILAPVISDVLDALQDSADVLLARMSGSGATCFGLFPTPASARSAAAALRDDHPDWWVRDCVLS